MRSPYLLSVGKLRDRRRHHLIESEPIDDKVWDMALRHHPLLLQLNRSDRAELRNLATIFVREKEFESDGGIELTDLVRVRIAALAALPILRLGIDWYDNWTTTVVLPRPWVEEHTSRDAVGVVHEWLATDAGESYRKGPVVLSWRDVASSGQGRGFNVVIHEATHRLDMTDGAVNGRPALHDGIDVKQWYDVFRTAYQDFTARIGSGRRTRIDPYAATNDAEFFAVVTETFFERPGILHTEYPDLYVLLSEFYKQDPLGARTRIV
jgi:hypothetical protein